ncbi:MAG: zinc ABC transporter substrate-binding protein [Oscillospiraceae bacterium]|nr:zinc ABC transporter substrate-binding protein [Oscillospiraceae bacterium]
MMKRILWILCLCCLLPALPGCGQTAETEENQTGLGIVTTVFPAYDFARQIAGERAQVTLLLPPGAESHSFEPTARDILRIQNGDLFFYTGGESEEWAEELLEGQESVNALAMLDCVDALEEECKEGMQDIHEEEDGDEGEEYDEHVWTSPVNAQRICRRLCEELCRLDPAGEDLYLENTESYCEKLAALDADFRRVVEAAPLRTVIFADRFPVRYFVEEYGLDYYAAFPGCAEDTEPSARTVAFLIDKVQREQIPAVFTIEFSNGKMADVICEDTGCEKLLFHSCHTVSADDLKRGVTYLELMAQNVDSLKEALGGNGNSDM